jgi:hypothetical protein
MNQGERSITNALSKAKAAHKAVGRIAMADFYVALIAIIVAVAILLDSSG